MIVVALMMSGRSSGGDMAIDFTRAKRWDVLHVVLSDVLGKSSKLIGNLEF